jgi:STE24 endopeptidase
MLRRTSAATPLLACLVFVHGAPAPAQAPPPPVSVAATPTPSQGAETAPLASSPAAQGGDAPQAAGSEPLRARPTGSTIGAPLDPEAATRAYLDRLTPEQRARSDAYFEGGYWLQLWELLYGLGVAWLLLASGLSARIRDGANRLVRFRPVRNFLYAGAYILLTTVLTLPLTLYRGFFREHKYGLSTQELPEWLLDLAKGTGVGIVLGGLALVALYAVLRRAPRTWWVWGAVVSLFFLAFAVLIAPVYIDPLFNKYERLEDPRVRDPILRMAQANGVPVHDVWVFDASRQTTRISANVSGLLGTERIRLNDNLLERTSLPEIEAVMGHELGHYVLNHVWELLLELGVVFVLGFAFLRLTFERARRRWGARWRVQGIDDPAGLPLLAALLAVYFFLMTPVLNTIIRVNEVEADAFGLNSARQPDGFAEVSLKLAEYRKLEPTPLEEAIFFDHPSGRNRILMAMRWKAATQAVEGGAAPAPAP